MLQVTQHLVAEAVLLKFFFQRSCSSNFFISKDITSKMLHGLGPLLEGDFKRRSDALEKERTKIISRLHGENTDEDKGGTTPPPGAKIIEYDSSGNRLP